ncbi:(5-formylfuran-3-yl)methyl phosphate synthase [Novipirellula maiorica]|uniref:(5-formylfuran-3-yl)methyl phosphate synthase n=1 Tax=Novipirellula maiorica TaxID=1265734 RepID=UPI000691A36F|nr:(5-formylfuran-3-yl)methyl phosphate synthase [Rhodopirellula maiorica]
MTDLLVSVRDDCEFQDAIATGVGIIDFKEPRHGALAPVDPTVWHSAALRITELNQLNRFTAAGGDSLIPARPRLSAALGEAEGWQAVASQLPRTFDFAKIGPSQIKTAAAMQGLWESASQCIGPTTELVAVAYADSDSAACLPAEQVFQLAGEFGFRRCLIDTFSKTGRSSIEYLGYERLRTIGQIAKQASMKWSLAGSIRIAMIDSLISERIFPDCYAVRGDVCHQGRSGRLCASRLKQWVDRMALMHSRSFGPIESC